MKNQVLIISFLLLVASCQLNKQNNKSDDKTIFCDVDEWSGNPLNISDLIEDLEIISLETNENNLIGFIRELAKIGDQLIVFDQQGQKFIAFDLQGNFKHFIGKKGKGPGEYTHSSGFIVPPDKNQIIIKTAYKNSLIHYSLQGKFIKENRLSRRGSLGMGFINDTLIAIHAGRMGSFGVNNNHFELWIMNEKGRVVDSLFHYTDAQLFDFGGNLVPSYDKGSVLYTKLGDYSIYKLSAGRVDTLYRFDFGAANLDTAFFLRKENFEEMRRLPDKVQSFTTVTNTRNDLFAAFRMKGLSKGMVLVNHESGSHKNFPVDSTGMGAYEGISIPIPRWADDSHRYSTMPAYMWEILVNDLTQEQKEICRKKIQGFKQSEAITADDNPIIFRFKFKDF